LGAPGAGERENRSQYQEDRDLNLKPIVSLSKTRVGQTIGGNASGHEPEREDSQPTQFLVEQQDPRESWRCLKKGKGDPEGGVVQRHTGKPGSKPVGVLLPNSRWKNPPSQGNKLVHDESKA
jgi:hypothetical protein